MIEVFHGSTVKVEQPLVAVGRDNLDFGKGFYVTTLKEQAERWAETIAKLRVTGAPCVNRYRLNYEGFMKNPQYRVRRFMEYDEEWLDFVIGCRQGETEWKRYDVIEGGIANDRVFDTIENYMAGQIDKQTALGRLRFQLPNNQICLLNQELVSLHLEFLDCETL